MNAEQRQRFLPEYLSDDSYHLAIALHEPDTELGYDYFVDEIAGAGDKTRAMQRSDGSWIINGSKSFQTNGSIAKLIAVRTRTEWGSAAFLVPRTTPGLSCVLIDGSGRRLAGWAELYFDNCVVPDENRLGENRRAIADRARLGEHRADSIGGAGSWPGGLRGGDGVYETAGPRWQADHPASGGRMALAEMAMNLDAARTMIWHFAWLVDQIKATGNLKVMGEAGMAGKNPTVMAGMTALFTFQVAFDVACRASTLFGGAGVMRECPMQKYIRDTSVYLHAAPRDVGLLRIAEGLAGYKRPSGMFTGEG